MGLEQRNFQMEILMLEIIITENLKDMVELIFYVKSFKK